MSIGDIAADVALSWVGTPYRHQASCKGAGTDCLGLLRGVWRELIGAEPETIPAYSADWSEPQAQEELWAAARRHLQPKPQEFAARGDIVLFRMRAQSVAKHVGIQVAIGPEPAFVHAYSGHGVTVSPLSDPWQRRVVARFCFPH